MWAKSPRSQPSLKLAVGQDALDDFCARHHPIAAAGLSRTRSPTRAVSATLNEDARSGRLDDTSTAGPREVGPLLRARDLRLRQTGSVMDIDGQRALPSHVRCSRRVGG
jgi:hypothetical protein